MSASHNNKEVAIQQEFFSAEAKEHSGRIALAETAVLLSGFAEPHAAELIGALVEVTVASPFRHMTVRGGHRMSVAMTNCGHLGWISDESGYRYDTVDPVTGRDWPRIPVNLMQLAQRAADDAGFYDFVPDACLINRYEPGAQMGLHQDKNEQDYTAPIVSVSLGLPATFLFGGAKRSDRPQRVRVENGDVIVWGGSTRLAYHGVAKLAAGHHPLTGAARINLTFRKAG